MGLAKKLTEVVFSQNSMLGGKKRDKRTKHKSVVVGQKVCEAERKCA